MALADERGDWREDGAASMAGWLCARLGLRSANAAEWLRVAHALEALPECARAYAEGRLAWGEGGAQLEGEHPVAIEVARRLACDCRLELVAEGPDGVPVGWAGRGGRSRPGCGGWSCAATGGAAGSRAATTRAGWRATTSGGGRGAGRPTWTTSSARAATATGWSTSWAGR